MSANPEPLAVTKKYYGEVAQQYDQRRQAKPAFHDDQFVLKQLLAGIVREGTQVLDVACGTNRLSPVVRELGGIYHGVDVSSDMIALARQKDPESNFMVADARNIPHPASKFDLIVTVKFLKWLPDDASLRSVIGEVSRLLRPGGRAILHQKIENRLGAKRSLRDHLRSLASLLRGGEKKANSNSPRTRAVDEEAFLKMCAESGLQFRAVMLTSSLVQIGCKRRISGFFLMEKTG